MSFSTYYDEEHERGYHRYQNDRHSYQDPYYYETEEVLRAANSSYSHQRYSSFAEANFPMNKVQLGMHMQSSSFDAAKFRKSEFQKKTSSGRVVTSPDLKPSQPSRPFILTAREQGRSYKPNARAKTFCGNFNLDGSSGPGQESIQKPQHGRRRTRRPAKNDWSQFSREYLDCEMLKEECDKIEADGNALSEPLSEPHKRLLNHYHSERSKSRGVSKTLSFNGVSSSPLRLQAPNTPTPSMSPAQTWFDSHHSTPGHNRSRSRPLVNPLSPPFSKRTCGADFTETPPSKKKSPHNGHNLSVPHDGHSPKNSVTWHDKRDPTRDTPSRDEKRYSKLVFPGEADRISGSSQRSRDRKSMDQFDNRSMNASVDSSRGSRDRSGSAFVNRAATVCERFQRPGEMDKRKSNNNRQESNAVSKTLNRNKKGQREQCNKVAIKLEKPVQAQGKRKQEKNANNTKGKQQNTGTNWKKPDQVQYVLWKIEKLCIRHGIPIVPWISGDLIVKVGIRSAKHLAGIAEVLTDVIEKKRVQIDQLSIPLQIDPKRRKRGFLVFTTVKEPSDVKIVEQAFSECGLNYKVNIVPEDKEKKEQKEAENVETPVKTTEVETKEKKMSYAQKLRSNSPDESARKAKKWRQNNHFAALSSNNSASTSDEMQQETSCDTECSEMSHSPKSPVRSPRLSNDLNMERRRSPQQNKERKNTEVKTKFHKKRRKGKQHNARTQMRYQSGNKYSATQKRATPSRK